MKLKAQGFGVLMDERGRFWTRPWINHRRTTRRLKARTLQKAIVEVDDKPWLAKAANFAALAAMYLEEDCPNKRLESREGEFVKSETARVRTLIEFFGRYPCEEIILPRLPEYKRWRIKRITKGTGERTVDKDLCTLSNVLNFGVQRGEVNTNAVAFGRPKFQSSSKVRHCRESAPASATVLHQCAEFFFDWPRSEVLGWQLFYTMFTGCRTSELLRLRLDADSSGDPGRLEFDGRGNGMLFLRRSKGGVNPFSPVGPEFKEMITCHRHWHAMRFPDSQWYLPSPLFDRPITRHALANGLARACAAFDLPKITPHGIRSFHVTKRRSDGASDVQIAGEIGDQTTLLMQTTYGSRPPNWDGGRALNWLPGKGLKPAWLRWAPADGRRNGAKSGRNGFSGLKSGLNGQKWTKTKNRPHKT